MPKAPATKSRKKVAPKKHLTTAISTECLAAGFVRADLVFDGLDHSGASFEARIFINNPDADANTEMTAQNRYAGRFHIFGHGGCFGDVGHCEVRGVPRPYDPRPAHPLTPMRKVVIATEALRREIKRSNGKGLTLTIVPVVCSGTVRCDYENVLKFDRVSVVTYA
jgi:tyrosinase